ncbi:MAG: KTSC domain-containing protein [Coriobacteriia bacterium]|nr:KTSC domain-containing protein [Coriobacteriia bacterium]
MPDMQYVDSSNIAACGYDADQQELHVEFIASGVYVYRGVPSYVFEELMASPSKGSYFNRHIKPVFTDFTRL